MKIGDFALYTHITKAVDAEELPDHKVPICCDCQYCGDKYSFPEPNDLLDAYPGTPFLKHLYCCCGDCGLYKKDISILDIQQCEHFEEL